MTGLLLCMMAAVTSYLAGSRSLRWGLCAVLTIGYFYGIVRANVSDGAGYFIFDCALIALFAARLTRPERTAVSTQEVKLRQWLWLLFVWPLILLASPVQDPLVRLVGFRAQVFFLPFLLFGARLGSADLKALAKWCAFLNIVALGFGLAEYRLGLSSFFPQTAITEILYNSQDVGGNNWRIPATFSSAHAYAGTLVMTLPFILGALQQRRDSAWTTAILVCGALAAAVGTFAAAARMHALVLLLLLIVSAHSLVVRFGGVARLALVLVVVATSITVWQDPRLQRFTTLSDTDYVRNRVGVSVNSGLLSYAVEYPLGNGLGGGGTSMPYFLRDRVRDAVSVENQYGTIMLELGLPGLVLWLSALGWVLLRAGRANKGSWTMTKRTGRLATFCYVVAGTIGTGMFTSVPQSCLLLLTMGWLTVDEEQPQGPVGQAAARKPFPASRETERARPMVQT